MKYMSMMNAPRGTGDWAVYKWAPDDFKAHIAFMRQFSQELSQAGELVGGEGLASPAQAKIVRALPSGAPEVTEASQGIPNTQATMPTPAVSEWASSSGRE